MAKIADNCVEKTRWQFTSRSHAPAWERIFEHEKNKVTKYLFICTCRMRYRGRWERENKVKIHLSFPCSGVGTHIGAWEKQGD